ncbi:MAG: hypothetical protein NVSMB4_18760 [Acidimicrobiales bacterium]
MPAMTSYFRGLAYRSLESVELVSGSAAIGAGGVTVAPTATTTVHVAVPRRKCKLVSLNLMVLTAAAGGGAITAQAFKRDNTGTPADRTLTAATDLTATNFTVADKAYPFPFLATATDAQEIFQPGDTLRVNVVAASTVTTAPQVVVVAEFAVLA